MTKKIPTTSKRYVEQAFCKHCRPAMRGPYAEWKSTNTVDAEWIRLTGGECGECQLVMLVGESYWFFTQSSEDHPKRWGSAQQFTADQRERAGEAAAEEAALQLTIEDAIDAADDQEETQSMTSTVDNADGLTPAGVQTAIEAELAQADAEHAAAAAAEPIPDNDRRNRPPMEFVYEMSWGRMEQLVAGAKANQHASTALNQVDYLTEVIQQAELMRARAIDVARQDGESWAAIGAQLGISKQAAQQRYGKKP